MAAAIGTLQDAYPTTLHSMLPSIHVMQSNRPQQVAVAVAVVHPQAVDQAAREAVDGA